MGLVRPALKLFSSSITNAAINFLGVVLFSRLLGAAPMGTYFLFWALLGLLSIPADFGLRGAIEKRISESRGDGESYLTTAIILKLIPLAVLGIAILGLRGLINDYLGANLAMWLLGGIILQELGWTMTMSLHGEIRVGETAVIQVARQATWFVVGLFFIQLGHGVYALVYGVLTSYLVMFLLGWYRSTLSLGYPTARHVRSLLKYAKFDAISFSGWKLFDWIDVFILGLFVSQSLVAAYEVAWKLTTVVILLSNALSISALPQFSDWHARGEIERIESLFPSLITFSLVLVMPAFAGVMLFSEELLSFIFGPEFGVAWLVLIILMLQKLLHSIYVIFERTIKGMDHPEIAGIAIGGGVILDAVLNFALIPEFGIIGAAVATTLAFAGSTIYCIYATTQIITIKFPYLNVAWLTTATVAMVLTLIGLKAAISVTSLGILVALVAVGGLTYGVFIVLIPDLRKEARTLVNS